MALKVGMLAAALICAGILLAQTRAVAPIACFGVSMLGGAIGLTVLPAALVAWRRGALQGWPMALGVLFWVGPGLLLFSARGKPRINDVTTDPKDPPEFVAAKLASANSGREMQYPAVNQALQRAGYPDLAPLTLAVPPQEASKRAVDVAQELGWQLVTLAADETRLEAQTESRAFHFVDDIVVRFRPRGAGTLVDMRSKSRDGKGDLGKNADRIRAFMDKLGGAAKP